MGFILFIVAFTLTTILGTISLVYSVVYYLVTLKWISGLKALNEFFYKLALSIDQFGNVVCAIPFQYILTQGNSHKFGEEDDTVSYVIARNKYRGTLTCTGHLLGDILEFLDTSHLKKTIQKKKIKDKEAVKRYNSNKYYE